MSHEQQVSLHIQPNVGQFDDSIEEEGVGTPGWCDFIATDNGVSFIGNVDRSNTTAVEQTPTGKVGVAGSFAVAKLPAQKNSSFQNNTTRIAGLVTDWRQRPQTRPNDSFLFSATTESGNVRLSSTTSRPYTAIEHSNVELQYFATKLTRHGDKNPVPTVSQPNYLLTGYSPVQQQRRRHIDDSSLDSTTSNSGNTPGANPRFLPWPSRMLQQQQQQQKGEQDTTTVDTKSNTDGSCCRIIQSVQRQRSKPVGTMIVTNTTTNCRPMTTGASNNNTIPPKSALHCIYGQPPRHKVVSSTEHFFTWNDQGPSHLLKWSAAFVCPLTGEVFLAAPLSTYGDYNRDGSVQIRGSCSELWWFPKKNLAEHGAAARAYDCLVYRDAVRTASTTQTVKRITGASIFVPVSPNEYIKMGVQLPYDLDQARFDLPPPCESNVIAIPNRIRQKIQQLQTQISYNNNYLMTIPIPSIASTDAYHEGSR